MPSLDHMTKTELKKEVEKLKAEHEKYKSDHESLQNNELKMRAILDHHFQMTGMLDIEGKLVAANKTALELIQSKESDVLGKLFWKCDWWEHSQQQEVHSAFQRAVKGEFVRFETTHLNYKNEKRNVDFSFNPVIDDHGKVVYVIPEGRDITSKNQAKVALQISEEKFLKVFDFNPLPISITDIPDGNYLDVNHMFEKVSGFKKEEVLGKSIKDIGLYTNPNDHQRIISTLQEEGKLMDFKIDFKTKHGEIRHCRLFSEVVEIRGTPYIISMVYDDTDRKQAKQAELESKKRYGDLMDMLPEPVFETDKDRNITYANQQAFDTFGYSQEEFKKGMNVLDLLTPADREKARRYDSMRMKGLNPGPIEYKVVRKDGSSFPVLSHAISIMKQDKLKGLLGIMFDITKRKYAEDRLTESEKKFRTLFESANDGILILKNNKIIECNSKGVSLFGYADKNEIIGLTPSDLSPDFQPDGRKTSVHERANLARVRKGIPQRFNWRHIRKDGSLFDAEISLNIIDFDDNTHVQAIIRDITDRLQAQKKLKESEARFKRLFEDLGDAVYVTILGGENIGKILEANPAAVRQTGYSRNELLSMNIIHDLYVSGSGGLQQESWENKISSGEIVTSVEKKKRKDGSIYWTEVLVTPIYFMGINACLSINRDITERIKNEEDLKKALRKAKESDKLKSAFLASMSHEIRTPLNAIIGFSNIIADSVGNTELYEFSSLINKQNNLLLKLVDDILDFARVESGSLSINNERFDFNKLIDDLCEESQAEKESNTQLIPTKTSESLHIISDEHRIKQVFTNLISNAFKFTPEGRVEYGYDMVKPSEIRCFVKDTGIGIPHNQQDHIFERFVKLDEFSQGTGLGLSISRNIIRILGGKMWVKSTPNAGSAFYFTLPVNAEQEAKSDLPVARDSTSTDTSHRLLELKTVLVAEDDRSNYKYVKEILEGHSIKVLYAGHGLEAIQVLKSKDRIDLVLMDLKMPIMNGYDATRTIKRMKPKLPVIALTAYALKEDEQKAKEAGCDGFISKPFTKTDLMLMLRKQFALDS